MNTYKIFGTPYGYKIYNSLTNEIEDISKELSNFLLNNTFTLVAKDSYFINNSLHQEYQKLYIKGYFENSPVKMTENPITEYIVDFLERKLSHLVLQVTQDCNLRCSYCAYTENDGSQRTHSNKSMDEKMALESLEFFRQHSIDSKEIKISFYGGEPFINYKLIKLIINKSEEIFKNKKLDFNVTTNGTIFNRYILNFLDNHNVKLTISLDGGKEIHDSNRIYKNSLNSSFNKIRENISLIQSEYYTLFKNLSINTVMDPSVPFCKYTILYDEIPELKNVLVMADIVDDFMSNTKTRYSNNFMGPYEYEKFLTIIDILREQNNYKEKVCYSQIKQLEGIVERITSSTLTSDSVPSGPCMPGYKKLFIDISGNFYPCEKIRETSKCMVIGDLERGWDYDTIKDQLNIHLLTREDCLSCWAFRLCDSCVLFSDDGDTLSSDKRLSFCEENRNKALYKLNYYVAYNKLIEKKGGI